MASRFLLCSPDHFDAPLEDGPQSPRGRTPDLEASWNTWWQLVADLRELGAEVHHFPSRRGRPDMVFPGDHALVDGDRFLRAEPRDPARRDSATDGVDWLLRRGFTELPWPADEPEAFHSGDAVGFAGVLVCGTGARTSSRAARRAGRTLDVETVTVPLADPRLPGLDLCFLPLDDRRALYAPDALSAEGRRRIERLVPEPIMITLDEALRFCANSVVVGDTVVMPVCPPRVEQVLREQGFAVRVSPVDEFLGAGGGVRSMALNLDVLERRVPAVAR
ncbi:amidinotransferase [Streptomyces spiroverticillatus]|uniref:Amidinotransferase n=1 Tax=Streptomyces finlayi TaxID=67296 RepID=A0A919CAK0_9ACTN|nr:hypothetical protein [Streptomyces finlayi]GHA11577.1 amidinotransferase [Streptomyces spiroverticillatus]GHC94948.1 amidinotransferase [Streptomyces finlayi]